MQDQEQETHSSKGFETLAQSIDPRAYQVHTAVGFDQHQLAPFYGESARIEAT